MVQGMKYQTCSSLSFRPALSLACPTMAGLSFPLCPKALGPEVGDLSAAQPLHTNLPFPAQNPGPERVLRCRASTACPASWSASPRRAPRRPRFCWRTRSLSRLPTHTRRPPRAREIAAPPHQPPTLPSSVLRAPIPTPSTRCSEGESGRGRGRRCAPSEGWCPYGPLSPKD